MSRHLFSKNKRRGRINWEGSSEHLRKNLDLSKIIRTRLFIFATLCCLFIFALIGRLYYIQIISEELYEQKLLSYTTNYQTATTPRGELLDADGQVLVGSAQVLNITYFPPQSILGSQEWSLAYDFARDFQVDSSSLTERDLKDLYLTMFSDSFATWIESSGLTQYEIFYNELSVQIYNDLITEEEWSLFYDNELSSNDIYHLRLDRIDVSIFNEMDETLKATWSVKQLMDSGTIGETKVIMYDVSNQEVAFLMEHSAQYPGFEVEIDWERHYPYGETLKSVLGTVTTTSQGIPAELINQYLAVGYSRNEKVGRSGLELQYEHLLSGEKQVFDINYDENGVGVLSEVSPGVKGFDLQTTIDIDFQIEVDEVLRQLLVQYQDDPRREYMDRMSVVVMDPNNGDVLALSSMVETQSGIVADPVSTYTHAYEPGSIVKGAVVYMGHAEGVIDVGEVLLDEPIKIRATPTKSSWMNLGYISDIQALAQSSNVYMIKIAIMLAGGYYAYDAPLYVQDGTFELMRNYFSKFGLGVQTGLDIPNESIGYVGSSQSAGNITDFAIGQYDTYTMMQLAQYASTIANGGIKYQPRLVTRAYEPGTSQVVYENPVNILSTLDYTESIEQVQIGLLECVYGSQGICFGLDSGNTTIAAKTGTAQAYVTNDEGILVQAPHNSVIAYAPYENPEIAIACLIPNAWNGDKSQTNLCLEITRKVIEIYNGEYSAFDSAVMEEE